MAQESLLVCTADNNLICFELEYANNAEKTRKIAQYRQFCESRTYNEVIDVYNQFVRGSHQNRDILQQIDTNNTQFLHREITPYSFTREPQNFRNDLETPSFPDNIAHAPNTIRFAAKINNSAIPEMIKNLGYHITAHDNLYTVRFNPITQEYEVPGVDTRRASVYPGKKEVEYVRNHLQFPPAEYQQLQTMINNFRAARQTNPTLDIIDYAATIQDSRARSLFSVYMNEYTMIHHRELTILHELKHIKNDILYAGLMLKKDAKRLTVEDLYRYQVEDERSAYLSQAVNAVNKYLKRGNMNDFTMFDNETSWIANTLKTMPEQERVSFATDWPQIVRGVLTEFEQQHRDYYDRTQFPHNIEEKIKFLPLAAEEDTNHEEFRRLQRLIYNFEIYNPATGRMEHKSLSEHISPDLQVTLTPSIYSTIIRPNKQELENRKAEHARQVHSGEINPALVAEGKAIMRDSVRSPRLVSRVDSFEISDLYADTSRPEQTPTPAQPTPQPVPDDHAEWSDDLKRYWSQTEGYQEIAKNNNEYTFKVKNDTLRYTAQNKVQMSTDAQYETYVKLLNEPSNKNRPVEFKETLSPEQALKLYVACVNNGRQMKGHVPTDLSGIDRLRDIPQTDMQRFRQIQQTQQTQSAAQHNRQTPVRTNSAIRNSRGRGER